jgi:hypothetical protein
MFYGINWVEMNVVSSQAISEIESPHVDFCSVEDLNEGFQIEELYGDLQVNTKLIIQVLHWVWILNI